MDATESFVDDDVNLDVGDLYDEGDQPNESVQPENSVSVPDSTEQESDTSTAPESWIPFIVSVFTLSR